MRLLIVIISFLMLVSCKKDNRCFDGPGNIETRTIAFNSSNTVLNIYDDLNVTLINDSLNYIEITGGKNLINNISHEELSSELKLQNQNKCVFMSYGDSVRITVHYTQLKELGLYGYGDVNSTRTITHNLRVIGYDCFSSVNLEVNNDSTFFSLEGAPQVTLSGNSNYVYAYTVGKGNYHLEDLQTHWAHGHNNGIGDIHLRADESYIVELRSRGDIYLYDTLGTNRHITIDGEGSLFYE